MNKLKFLPLLIFTIVLNGCSAFGWLKFWDSEDEEEGPAELFTINSSVDIYTDWCGPCKLMDKNTFQNSDVAQYLNNNFYAVKFNAEGNTKVSFKGREFSNINYNESLKGGRNATHDFARYLGISGYPTIVFFDKDANR